MFIKRLLIPWNNQSLESCIKLGLKKDLKKIEVRLESKAKSKPLNRYGTTRFTGKKIKTDQNLKKNYTLK